MIQMIPAPGMGFIVMRSSYSTPKRDKVKKPGLVFGCVRLNAQFPLEEKHDRVGLKPNNRLLSDAQSIPYQTLITD
jgi:hypothetical protein